jgi:hypothetical protein
MLFDFGFPTALALAPACGGKVAAKVLSGMLLQTRTDKCVPITSGYVPDPAETSGHVLQRMELKLRLNREQIRRPDQRKLRPKISPAGKQPVCCPESTRLAASAADGYQSTNSSIA